VVGGGGAVGGPLPRGQSQARERLRIAAGKIWLSALSRRATAFDLALGAKGPGRRPSDVARAHEAAHGRAYPTRSRTPLGEESAGVEPIALADEVDVAPRDAGDGPWADAMEAPPRIHPHDQPIGPVAAGMERP